MIISIGIFDCPQTPAFWQTNLEKSLFSFSCKEQNSNIFDSCIIDGDIIKTCSIAHKIDLQLH